MLSGAERVVTPYPAETVSSTELKKTGAISLIQSLSYQPGIDRISVGNGIGKPVIRGMSFNRILIYAQGTRVENQQWDDRHDLGISEDGIDKVEIVNGPAALIYGAAVPVDLESIYCVTDGPRDLRRHSRRLEPRQDEGEVSLSLDRHCREVSRPYGRLYGGR